LARGWREEGKERIEKSKNGEIRKNRGKEIGRRKAALRESDATDLKVGHYI